MMGTSLRQKQQQPPLDGLAPISESEFSFTIARVAVAQICQSVGFKGAQNSALEALTDITTRYLEAIAKLGAASCNSNRRTQSNLPDFIVALEDLASIQGFPGSSDIRSHSLWTSAVIKDLMKLVKYRDEIPFAQPLPPKRSFFQGAKRRLLKHKGIIRDGIVMGQLEACAQLVTSGASGGGAGQGGGGKEGGSKWECWEERKRKNGNVGGRRWKGSAMMKFFKYQEKEGK
ncbi:UNVERIFIED_CONTAM: Transcription initiation factor TFIID subunit [Sesamum calycinum]|uniref:Transcription initiation factor TFIID subunit n=1 Tax=Sesamum calycinum TaxID=2727403 RepID=A0AAW2JED8_9LAMI